MFKIAHTAIVVKNLEVSEAFYSEVLDGEYIGNSENDRLKFAYLEISGQTIELLQYKEQEEGLRGIGAIDHIAFYVEDIEKEVERLKKLNINLSFDEIKEVNGMKIMFFTGPDGERIEFIEK